MANKRKRLDRKTLIFFGAALGFQSLACTGMVMSIHNKKSGLEETLKGKETALSNVRTVSASLPAMQDQYSKMQAQVRFLEQSLPPQAYIPTLLGQVERTAIASGVKIQDFRPKPAPPSANMAPGGPAQQQFDMTVIGTYAQVQKFLKNLTQFRKILALSSIKLQPMGSAQMKASPILNAGLSFTAYVLPPIPDINESDMPAPRSTADASPANGTNGTTTGTVANGTVTNGTVALAENTGVARIAARDNEAQAGNGAQTQAGSPALTGNGAQTPTGNGAQNAAPRG